MNFMWVIILILFCPLILPALDKKIDKAFLSFILVLLFPVFFYYGFLYNFIGHQLIYLIIFPVIGSYLLSEIKIKQYKSGYISNQKIWFSNLLITFWVTTMPILGASIYSFFSDEKDLTPAFVMMFFSVPISIVFCLYFSLRVLCTKIKKISSSLETTSISE
ncbi:MAG: hypothetical protein A3B66_00870 [Alphaproteobacteria bacterium RIFCSPHIGHO2_02_FULL_46_13]|nr:MAG: hypothetical protein A3B66_00870 [Alphaproteobacteria bacterium RIFCSPHIGHO2_02_FULL_46_13]